MASCRRSWKRISCISFFNFTLSRVNLMALDYIPKTVSASTLQGNSVHYDKTFAWCYLSIITINKIQNWMLSFLSGLMEHSLQAQLFVPVAYCGHVHLHCANSVTIWWVWLLNGSVLALASDKRKGCQNSRPKTKKPPRRLPFQRCFKWSGWWDSNSRP